MTTKAMPYVRAAVLAMAFSSVALALAACGHHHHDYGDAVVDNRTDLTTNEQLLTFHVAPFGLPFTGDLLGGPLDPLNARFVATLRNDYYDAEGELELGQMIEWFDEFVGYGDTTVFEVR
jgi:hypothetical protein